MGRSRVVGMFFVGGLGFLALGAVLFVGGAAVPATTFLIIGVCWAGVAMLHRSSTHGGWSRRPRRCHCPAMW